MARYAKVDVRIWDDEKVRRLTPIPACGQGLWIRLLVSRHRSAVPGILCVGEAALAEEFGWTLEGFRKAFREAFQEGLVKADWKARVVWLPKACFYNRPESPNVVKSWRIPWDETPECGLKTEAFRVLKAFVEGLPKAFQEAFGEACEKPLAKALANQEQDPDQEQEQEQDPLICHETPGDGHHVQLSGPPIFTYPCDGKPSYWSLTQSQVDEWRKLFPSVDVLGESARALAWIQASPERKKTARGMARFLVGWFGRTQNRGSSVNKAMDVRVGHGRAEDADNTREGDIPL